MHSIIPPTTQPNTPYPSTAYLTCSLRSGGVDPVQEDLAPTLILQLLSPQGLLALNPLTDALPPAKRHERVPAFAAPFVRCAGPLAQALDAGERPLLALLRYEQQRGLGLAVRKYLLTRRNLLSSAAQRKPAAALSATACAEVEHLLGRLARHDARAARGALVDTP